MERLARSAPSEVEAPADTSFVSCEIVEIKPIALGGSPTELANKRMLNVKQHVDYVRFWNRVISSAT
jgi:hypothetical protein